MPEVIVRPDGPTLDPPVVAGMLYARGWKDAEGLRDMLAIILAGSSCNPRAFAADLYTVQSLEAGTVIREWDLEGQKVRGEFFVANPNAGILNPGVGGSSRQVLPGTLVVERGRIGLALVPVTAPELAGTSSLWDPDTNLHKARDLWVRQGFGPWQRFHNRIADPEAPYRPAAARAVGVWLATT